MFSGLLCFKQFANFKQISHIAFYIHFLLPLFFSPQMLSSWLYSQQNNSSTIMTHDPSSTSSFPFLMQNNTRAISLCSQVLFCYLLISIVVLRLNPPLEVQETIGPSCKKVHWGLSNVRSQSLRHPSQPLWLAYFPYCAALWALCWEGHLPPFRQFSCWMQTDLLSSQN